MNDKILQMFVGRPVEQQFVALALAAVLGEDKVDEILSGLNDTGRTGREEIAGRPLRFYSGLSKAQLKEIGLSDKEADEVYEKLGVEDEGGAAGEPERAASAPVELAKLEETPEGATPESQAKRLETELDADREEEGSEEPDSSGPTVTGLVDFTVDNSDVGLSTNASGRKTSKRGK